MIKIDRAVIVEGRYDKIKLSSIIDGIIIETEGFGIFNNKEKQHLIRKLAGEKGLLVLTDSDSAGFKIRSFIKGIVPAEQIKHAYIPDILGKERRKTEASKEGKLGVEGICPELLVQALEKAGVICKESHNKQHREITKTDLFEDGLSGGEHSDMLRKKLLKHLELPERMTSNALVQMLNTFLTFDEYKKAVEEIKNATEER